MDTHCRLRYSILIKSICKSSPTLQHHTKFKSPAFMSTTTTSTSLTPFSFSAGTWTCPRRVSQHISAVERWKILFSVYKSTEDLCTRKQNRSESMKCQNASSHAIDYRSSKYECIRSTVWYHRETERSEILLCRCVFGLLKPVSNTYSAQFGLFELESLGSGRNSNTSQSNTASATADEKSLRTKSVCGRKILAFKNCRLFVRELVRKMSFL